MPVVDSRKFKMERLKGHSNQFNVKDILNKILLSSNIS